MVEERGGEPFLLPIAGETERTAMALFHHDTPLETPGVHRQLVMLADSSAAAATPCAAPGSAASRHVRRPS